MFTIAWYGSTISFLSYYPLFAQKSETTLILAVLISAIAVFALYKFIPLPIWGSELSDDHLRHGREILAKRCSVTYTYESSDCSYLIPEFTGAFVYDISIKIFIIDNIIFKRATYIVSFGLVSGIVVLAVCAAMDFSGVMLHPTLETVSTARSSGQGLVADIAIWWIISALWDVLAFVLYPNLHRNTYQLTNLSSSHFFNHKFRIYSLAVFWPRYEIYYHIHYH